MFLLFKILFEINNLTQRLVIFYRKCFSQISCICIKLLNFIYFYFPLPTLCQGQKCSKNINIKNSGLKMGYLQFALCFCHQNMVCNVETEFHGTVNINVVCMAPHTQVFILCVICNISRFVNFMTLRTYLTIFELVNCTKYT